MNSNKFGIAVLLLALVLIPVVLAVSAFGNAEAPVVPTESELNIDPSCPVDELSSPNAEGVDSENPSDSSREESYFEESLPNEPSFPEEEFSEPEVSEPVRVPQGNETEESFALQITVKDPDGYAVAGAYVTAGDIAGFTNEKGIFSFHTVDAEFVLCVEAEGFVSLHEEVNAEELGGAFSLTLEKASSIRLLLNSAQLRPYTFANQQLNETIDELFSMLFEPGMDTYDKVKACYDWLVKNTVYKRPGHKGDGYWDCALQVFQDGRGTCDCYSSAFAAMMRRLGLESYVVEGVTSANVGGMTGHVWSFLVIDGKTYIFDPQVEDAIADRTSSKEIQYVRFCVPEPNGKYKYNGASRSRQMEKFDRFLEENGYFS